MISEYGEYEIYLVLNSEPEKVHGNSTLSTGAMNRLIRKKLTPYLTLSIKGHIVGAMNKARPEGRSPVSSIFCARVPNPSRTRLGARSKKYGHQVMIDAGKGVRGLMHEHVPASRRSAFKSNEILVVHLCKKRMLRRQKARQPMPATPGPGTAIDADNRADDLLGCRWPRWRLRHSLYG